ncbi:MAG: hypothetical protein QM802_00215 [Agriterribacter sp.]
MKVTAKYILVSSIILLNTYISRAQNTSSPYSIIGIGDIEESYFNRTTGMANTGIAYRSRFYTVGNNPASYSALQEQFFVVEASGRGKFVSYYANNLQSSSNQTKDFSVSRFSLAIKARKWWGTSVGIMPFSTANYSFTGKKSIQGTNLFTTADYLGTGGVHKAYWDNGVSIGKHFSVGVGASFLFGSITQTETLEGTSTTDAITTTRNIYMHNLYFNYGAQFYTKVNSKWDLALGGTYANRTNLTADYTTTVATGSTTIHSDDSKSDYFKLPNSVGMGLALTKSKKLTMLADYRYQDWSTLNYKGQGYSLKNSNRASAGIEFSTMQQVWPVVVEKVFYQAGVFYSNSYLNINNQQLKDMGLSVGMGFNSKRSTLSYMLNFEYGIRGTKQNNLIQERYGKITFTLSYKDLWYTKGVKYN